MDAPEFRSRQPRHGRGVPPSAPLAPKVATGEASRRRSCCMDRTCLVLILLSFALSVLLVTPRLRAMWSPYPPERLIGLLGLLPASSKYSPATSSSSSSLSSSSLPSSSLPSSSSSSIFLPPPPLSSQTPSVDLGWYPPKRGQVNDLGAVVNGTGTWGFIYSSSTNPPGTPYGTYNWANMPHVRTDTYVRAPEGFELVYVELVHRHHKRTPYAANGFPVEAYHWNCDDQGLFYYGEHFDRDPSSSSPSSPSSSGTGRQAPAPVYWQGFIAPINPFVPDGWVGTCQFPQITAAGLDDAFQHGRDLYDVYHGLLGFLPSADEFLSSSVNSPSSTASQVTYRVTTNQITSQTVSNIIAGMWTPPSSSPVVLPSLPLLVQSPTIDSLEPRYPCPAGASLFATVQSSSNPSWAAHLAAAVPLLADLDAISGVPPADRAWHVSFDHYYDNLSARQGHQKPLPCQVSGGSDTSSSSPCVTQRMADTVYRYGNWEWSHMYRNAGPATLRASAALLGVWIAELAAHLQAAAMATTGPGSDSSSSSSSSNSRSRDMDNSGSEARNDHREPPQPQPQTKWFHNVAHDGTIGKLLSVLQADEMFWPGMGSEVVFELYRDATAAATGAGRGLSLSGHYVRVLFSGMVLRSSNPSLGVMDMIPVEVLLAYFNGLVGMKASLVTSMCHGEA